MADDRRPLKVAYVASLDLPDNRRAHAMQMLKNGQAMAQCVEDFEFITDVWWHNRKRLTPEVMGAFYGITHPFPIIGMPLRRFAGSNIPWLRQLYFKAAAWRCKLRGVDFIYTRTYPLVKESLKRGLATVVEIHSPPGRTPELDAMLPLMQHPKLLAFTTISQPLADRYREAGVPAEKLLVLPDGVDLERFAQPLTTAQARQKLGLDPQRPMGVYVGHLYDGRGIDTMLEAARRLPGVDFHIVGGYPKDIARWQQEANGLPNMRFAGFVENEQVPLHLWAGDFLMMPYGNGCATKEWMSPLKLFEYMAAQRPIISSDFPILREVISHEQEGYFAPPDDGPAWAQAIETLMADAALRQRMAEQGFQKVQAFSWKRRMEQVLEKVSPLLP
uniref:Putative GT4 n=1 Tax=Magnetococcus massalia (strain MO-1) TaxID=451514 RepID=A0A1S7LLG7_MAGMO|nr:putative GT4 [Candidatus Magnetococcus massalia]